MKKLLAIILTLCMTVSIFALAACESTQDPKETSGETERTEDPTTNEADNGNGGENTTTDTDKTDTNNTESNTNNSESHTNNSESDTAAEDNEPKQESTYLGKTPVQFYTDALTKLNSLKNYTVTSNALMESTQDNYHSTRLINAMLAGNALFAHITMDDENADKKREEKTWIVDGYIYQINTSGSKTKHAMSADQAASSISSFPMNYMMVMFNFTEEHFGDAKFLVTGETATVTITLTKEHLSALTGEESYKSAKSSDCAVEISFDKNGNITQYTFDWTIVQTRDDAEVTEHMKYDNAFSNIGSTAVSAPEDADSFTSGSESGNG